MKKISMFLTLALTLALLFTGCDTSKTSTTDEDNDECTHSWQDANCQTPKTCTFCGETKGEISSTHAFENDICKDCGLVNLTLYNYKDYIDCDATVKAKDSYDTGIYTSVECNFEAVGNTHYKYNDVSIVIEFSHYDIENNAQRALNDLLLYAGETITTEAVPHDKSTRTVELNLAGNGATTCTLFTPWKDDRSAYSDTKTVFDGTYYTVLSISGTVQEY